MLALFLTPVCGELDATDPSSKEYNHIKNMLDLSISSWNSLLCRLTSLTKLMYSIQNEDW